MDTKNLIEIIKINKKKNKITTLALSQKSGIPLGTLNKILSGNTSSVKIDTLNKIQNALNIQGFNDFQLKNQSENNDEYKDFGFVKCATCTITASVAGVSENVNEILNSIDLACKKGVDLLTFPELSITSSTCGDLFLQQELLNGALDGLFKIVEYSVDKNIIIVVGLPLKIKGRVYNVASIILNGEILGFVPKTNLNYNELRVFTNQYDDNKVEILGKIYNFSKNLLFTCTQRQNFSFRVNFGDIILDNLGEFITINLSSSPELIGKAEIREINLKSYSKTYSCGATYANAGFGESTTDFVYSGHSFIVENGKILSESKPFENCLLINDIDVDFLSFERSKNLLNVKNNEQIEVRFNLKVKKLKLTRKYKKYPFIASDSSLSAKRAEFILNMQSYALAKRVSHVNAKTLVLGISGGLDSTLALLVAVRTIKILNRSPKDVIAITIPCFGTTNRTKNNAILLSNALGVTLKEINIKKSVLSHFEDIGQDENIIDVTYENSQARERTQVLMDYANKTGGVVIGTGDLSELALGWATYNGDHMSNYGVNASIPKTLLRSLVEYEAKNSNKQIKEVLLDVLSTPVSPELIPAVNGEIKQKTEDIVGPYTLHDFFLYYFLRCGFGPRKIFEIAKVTFNDEFSEATLIKWLDNFFRRFFSQQFKRSCLPDGVKIGSVSLSPRGDFMMPSDVNNSVWKNELETLKMEFAK